MAGPGHNFCSTNPLKPLSFSAFKSTNEKVSTFASPLLASHFFWNSVLSGVCSGSATMPSKHDFYVYSCSSGDPQWGVSPEQLPHPLLEKAIPHGLKLEG